MKKDSGRLTELMTLLVFALFALGIMGLLLTGAGVWQRLTRQGQESQERRIREQYLATRVRQAQQVEVESFGDGMALILGERIGGEEYLTWVYLHEGYLWELFAPRGASPDPEDGERLLPLEHWELTLEEGLLTLDTGSGSQYLSIPNGKEIPK